LKKPGLILKNGCAVMLPVLTLLKMPSALSFSFLLLNVYSASDAGHGFYDNAFPPESEPFVGGILFDEGQYSPKTMYLAGGAGTYTRSPGGSTWTKQ
jgi:hypothetical protein